METRWNLSNIYNSLNSRQIREDYDQIVSIMDTTISLYSTLDKEALSGEVLVHHIRITNTLNSLILKLMAYARMVASADVENAQANSLREQLNKLVPRLNEMNVPFLRYLTRIDNLESWIMGSPLLEQHRMLLYDMQEQGRHLLSDEMEKIIADMQQTGSYAFEKMHNDLIERHLVDFRFQDEVQQLPLSVVRNMAYAQSQDIRKAAYKSELRSYNKISSAAAACLNAIKGEALTICRWRRFSSPLEMTLLDNRMNRQTLKAMLDTITDARPKFQKYLRKKASLLGHEDALPFYDLYAPMGEFDCHYTNEQARDLIVSTFTRFSSDLGSYARKVFDNAWIDLEPRDRKAGGTFCCNIYAVGESRIFSNFTGTFYDVTTLAHEIGHGYHYEKLNQNTMLNTDYTMPMAEMASILCQTLITDRILEEADDKMRFAILENDLMNYTQMLIEILCRHTFETNLFRRRKSGPLSVEELNQLMLDAQEYAYGDGMSDEKHPYMWVCKPHYYFPDFHYYNLSYPFGLLFAMGIYAMYQEDGAAFLPKYEQALSLSGHSFISGLFKCLGVTSIPEFFRNAMKQITRKIDDFCHLHID